jgi:hypothetical protein
MFIVPTLLCEGFSYDPQCEQAHLEDENGYDCDQSGVKVKFFHDAAHGSLRSARDGRLVLAGAIESYVVDGNL